MEFLFDRFSTADKNDDCEFDRELEWNEELWKKEVISKAPFRVTANRQTIPVLWNFDLLRKLILISLWFFRFLAAFIFVASLDIIYVVAAWRRNKKWV